MQTASDYSIKIANPPADATNPDDWRIFFQTYGNVTLCTVAVNNAHLLGKLVQRRKILKRLYQKLPQSAQDKDEALLGAVEEVSTTSWSIPGLTSSVESLYGKLIALDNAICSLLKPDTPYRAISVYVTFSTERGQRNALHVLSTGKLQIWNNTIEANRFRQNQEGTASRVLRIHENAESSRLPSLDDLLSGAPMTQKAEASDAVTLKWHSIHLVGSMDSQPDAKLESRLRFRGERVLNIKEAPEPNDIRWLDLQISARVRLLKFAASVCAMIWFVSWSAFFIRDVETSSPGTFFTPLFITVVCIQSENGMLMDSAREKSTHAIIVPCHETPTFNRQTFWFPKFVNLSMLWNRTRPKERVSLPCT
jgi:hypothetical protein